MSKLMSRTTSLLILFMIIVFLSPTIAHAAPSGDGYTSNRISGNPDEMVGVTITPGQNHNDPPIVELPNVQIQDAKNFVERKGFDIVSLLQTFAEPFSIGLFILGAFVAILGAFGRSAGVMKGVLIMGLAIIVYAAVIAAPELMDFGSSWLRE